ncbi:hypothetical protein AAJ76_307000986 [Vairimorpha ceranae]|uniref:Uncharacterized protein n=1 Tax=Vairimorpha ceranae TaxID=40302 RepID=A0A0F9W9L4_9MICR|nr:hypothetical protein AAJ76_307000986 [Vairimorpha ceranae]KKO73685.1 hypothetical protein AAJ76_307000986 [Vairimorpha ceranae]
MLAQLSKEKKIFNFASSLDSNSSSYFFSYILFLFHLKFNLPTFLRQPKFNPSAYLSKIYIILFLSFLYTLLLNICIKHYILLAWSFNQDTFYSL